MNVTFHVLAGITVATFLSPRKPELRKISLFAGFGISVALHGVLDYLPHSYPIRSFIDVPLAVLLFVTSAVPAKPHIRPLLIACFLGSIFPDLVDLAPGILNRHLGLKFTEVKRFPWHWKEFSGSIYDGSRAVESFIYHLLVLAALAFSIRRRRDVFQGDGRASKMPAETGLPSDRL